MASSKITSDLGKNTLVSKTMTIPTFKYVDFARVTMYRTEFQYYCEIIFESFGYYKITDGELPSGLSISVSVGTPNTVTISGTLEHATTLVIEKS